MDFKFFSDINLGKLTKYLRMLGYDTIQLKKSLPEMELAKLSIRESRIFLTRSQKIKLGNKFFIKSQSPKAQLLEVIKKFHQNNFPGFLTRCLECNSILDELAKEKASAKIPEKVREINERFFYCKKCEKIYWEGTHVKRMKNFLKFIKV